MLCAFGWTCTKWVLFYVSFFGFCGSRGMFVNAANTLVSRCVRCGLILICDVYLFFSLSSDELCEQLHSAGDCGLEST